MDSLLFRISLFALLLIVLRAGAGPCEEVAFSDPDSFKQAMTQGLKLQERQNLLMTFYLKNQFPFPVHILNYSLQSVYDVLNKHPDLLKPTFREQILTFSVEKKQTPESLKSFIASFRKSAGQIQNSLFRIEENYGYWVKMLGFSFPKTKVEPSDLPPDKGGLRGVNPTNKKALKQQQKQDFFAWLNTTALNQEARAFIQDTSKPLRERTIALYKALEEIRSHLLAQAHPEHSEKAIKNISQAMANLVHTVGFRNQAWVQGLRSKDPAVAFQALRNILNERDIVAFDLGFEGHFKELKEALGSKIPDETKVLNQIQEDINQPSHKEDGSTPLAPALQDGPAERTPLAPLNRGEQAIAPSEAGSTFREQAPQSFRLRALSLQESPFRSCLGGDCATSTEFAKGLDPNYIYFTLTDTQNKSSGHITVVLGTAHTKEGTNIPVAFVDKIQNMESHKLMAILEGISLSVKEQGYVLALPKDVGGMNGLANEGFIRDYVKSHILPKLQNPLTHFKPHKHNYHFGSRYSRAEDKLELLEFVINPPYPPLSGGNQNNPLEPGGLRGVEIRAGDMPTPKLASPTLSMRSLYEPILNLKESKKEEDQLKLLGQWLNLLQVRELQMSIQEVQEHLDFVLQNPAFSFAVRKKAFYTLIEFKLSKNDFDLDSYGYRSGNRYQSLILDFLEKQGELFSESEQKALIGEMSNWKNTKDYRNKFISKLNHIEIQRMIELGGESERTPLDPGGTSNNPLDPGKGETAISYLQNILNSPYEVLLDKNVLLIELSALGRLKMVRHLVNNSLVDINHKGGPTQSTALIVALNARQTQIAEELLKAGANPNIQNEEGDSALIIATSRRYRETINKLLTAGANPNSQGEFGTTALMLSAVKSETQIAEELLTAGANPNIQDDKGWTALMLASQAGHTETVRKLLKAGADPNTISHLGHTAHKLAVERGHQDIAQELLTAGAKPSIVHAE